MKYFRFVLVLVLVLTAVGLATNKVEAGKFYSYSSGIQLQNLQNSPASVELIYYNQDGSVDTDFVDPNPIAAYGSRTYFPINASAGFSGSVIVSSDVPLGAITNMLGSAGSSSGAAAYVAPSAGSTTLNLPLLMKGNNGIDTWFSIQSAGGDATVTVDYSDGTSVGPVVIKAGASHIFDQATETHSAKVFAATVTSGGQDLVGVVIEETPSYIMYAYTAFSSGSTNPVVPLVNANNNGTITGIQIQNAGGTDTAVTLSYSPSQAGTACTETQTIPAGGSKTFALNAFAGAPLTGMTTTCVNQKFIGSAQVTSNSTSQPLMAITNQAGSTIGEAYNGFDPNSATNTLMFPLIMDRNGAWYTGFSLINVGTGSTNVECTFSGGVSYTFSVSNLGIGKAAVDIQNGKIANKYVGSAVCTADGNGKLLGIVNEAALPGTSGDTLLVYEGINIQTTP